MIKRLTHFSFSAMPNMWLFVLFKRFPVQLHPCILDYWKGYFPALISGITLTPLQEVSDFKVTSRNRPPKYLWSIDPITTNKPDHRWGSLSSFICLVAWFTVGALPTVASAAFGRLTGKSFLYFRKRAYRLPCRELVERIDSTCISDSWIRSLDQTKTIELVK